MGFVWRETSNTDLGIDGYLEVIVNSVPSLEAGGSLALIGDESTLEKIVEWLPEHLHEDRKIVRT